MRIAIHQDVSLVLHGPFDGISEIPSDLLHEIATKGQRTRGQVNASSRKFHDEEQIVGDEPTFCPDFNRGEVDGCEHIPMRLDERLPSCLALPIWSWFDPMLFENVADGSIGNVIANVRQRALDPVVSPVQVFLGEAKDQIDDDLPDSWPADAFAIVAMIPFLSHQRSVPSQDRIRSDDGRQFHQRLSAKGLALDRQEPAMVVTQQKSLLPLSLHQRFDFGLIELDDLLLFVMDPTRQRHDEELPRLKDEIHATLDNRWCTRKPSPCCPVQQMSTAGLD